MQFNSVQFSHPAIQFNKFSIQHPYAPARLGLSLMLRTSTTLVTLLRLEVSMLITSIPVSEEARHTKTRRFLVWSKGAVAFVKE